MSDKRPLGTMFRSGTWEGVRSALADLSPREICTLFASLESDLTAYRNSQVLIMERLDIVGRNLVETREQLQKEKGNVVELLKRMGNSGDEYRMEFEKLHADLKRERELRLGLEVKLGVEVDAVAELRRNLEDADVEHNETVTKLRADLKREHELRLRLAVKLGVETGGDEDA